MSSWRPNDKKRASMNRERETGRQHKTSKKKQTGYDDNVNRLNDTIRYDFNFSISAATATSRAGHA